MASDLTPPKHPILDLTKEDLKPGTTSWLSTCTEIRQSLEEYGFLVVEYDTISSQLQDAIFGSLEELFNLPLETKLQNYYPKPHYGYVGQLPHIPLYEGLGMETSLQGIRSFTNLMWPAGNDRFCESVHSFTKILLELDLMVTRMIFESYGVSKYYDTHIDPMYYFLRVLKYREPRTDQETKIGLSPHTDNSFATLLYQNQINGLEIQTKNGGEWIDVKLSPSSFVFIAGDAIMGWSNGKIHAPVHRVIMNDSTMRYSLAFFSFRNGTIQVPEELVDDENPLHFKPFLHRDYLFYLSSLNGPKSISSLNSYCGV